MTVTATSPQTVITQKPAWLRTDDSACKQRGRQLGPGLFEFKVKTLPRDPCPPQGARHYQPG